VARRTSTGTSSTSINFERDIILERKLASGFYGTVYAAWWLNPPASALATLGPVEYLEVAPQGSTHGHEITSDQHGLTLVPAVKVAVKVVRLFGEDCATYSRRSMDSLAKEIQV
jgi:hypothetical protein